MLMRRPAGLSARSVFLVSSDSDLASPAVHFSVVIRSSMLPFLLHLPRLFRFRFAYYVFPNTRYMFLTSAMNLQLRGAFDVFYTGDEVCIPGGPNFDNAFYLSYSVMIGSLAGVAGVSLLYVGALFPVCESGRWRREPVVRLVAHAWTVPLALTSYPTRLLTFSVLYRLLCVVAYYLPCVTPCGCSSSVKWSFPAPGTGGRSGQPLSCRSLRRSLTLR